VPHPQQPATDCAGLVAQARATAAAIEAGDTGPGPMQALNNVLLHCPPAFARPIQCHDMMVDAQSKVRTNPPYSKRRAQEAAACYEGKPPPIREAANPPPQPPAPQPQWQKPKPGSGDQYCQNAPASTGAPGQRPKLRSERELDRAIGITPADYQVAQTSHGATTLHGGVQVTATSDGRDKFAYTDRTGRKCVITIKQYASDYCAWWWDFRKQLANAFFEESRKLSPAELKNFAGTNITANFVVTINGTTPVLVYDESYAASTLQHTVRGGNQPAQLTVAGPRYLYVVRNAFKRVSGNIPALPGGMMSYLQGLPSVFEQQSAGAYYVHGVYFYDRFGGTESIFLGCFDWLRDNHPLMLDADFQPPSPDPTQNTDLDPY
jgi:hypothetical protein